MAVLFKAFKDKTTTELGNFYVFLTRSIIRILIPISIVIACILSSNGTPMTFEGKDHIINIKTSQIQRH